MPTPSGLAWSLGQTFNRAFLSLKMLIDHPKTEFRHPAAGGFLPVAVLPGRQLWQ